MKNLILASAALCVSLSAFASASEVSADDSYFKTGAVTVSSEETVTDLTDADVFPVPLRAPEKVAGAAIVNGGVQAWNVINSGKPDASLSSSYASAIPGFSFNWANYSGWKKKEMVYDYVVTNLMGIDVIKIRYAVSFFYNGQDLRDDEADVKGHYITNFTVRPLETSVKWGWKFNMDVKMSDPMNVGSSKDPVAYMQADLNHVTSTPLSTDGGVWSYTVDGLGHFGDSSARSRAMTKEIGQVETLEVPQISWN